MDSFNRYVIICLTAMLMLLSAACSREYDEDQKFVYIDMMPNEIVIDSVNGGNAESIYSIPLAASIYSICSSPSADKIYFGLTESGPLHSVCIINADGSGFRKIYTATASISVLSVSPSGKYICFVDGGNIITIDQEGLPVNSIGITPPVIISMSVKEPYLYARDNSSNLVRYNFLTGSSAVVITASFGYDCIASLMPETDSVAGMTNGDLNTIYLTHLDGASVISSNIINVTGAGAVDYFSFSPDGSIYAGSNLAGQVRLYNLEDGSLIRYISNAWQPAFMGRPK